MRYCFNPVDGKYPTLNELEYSGDLSKKDPGFLDLLVSFILDLRKRAFFSGYSLGVQDAISDLGANEASFDADICKIGAERRWVESEAGNSEYTIEAV